MYRCIPCQEKRRECIMEGISVLDPPIPSVEEARADQWWEDLEGGSKTEIMATMILVNMPKDDWNRLG
jgi:hypothetical protein